MSFDPKTENFSVHPGVLERIKANKEATQIKKEEIAEDNINDFEDLEQSEDLQQLRALKLKQRKLKAQLKFEKGIEEEDEMNLEPSRRASAREALRANYTILVVDTNFMLSSLDIFKLMINETNDYVFLTPVCFTIQR